MTEQARAPSRLVDDALDPAFQPTPLPPCWDSRNESAAGLPSCSVDPTTNDGKTRRRVFSDGAEFRLTLFFSFTGVEAKLDAITAQGAAVVDLINPSDLNSVGFLKSFAGPYYSFVKRTGRQVSPASLKVDASRGQTWRFRHRLLNWNSTLSSVAPVDGENSTTADPSAWTYANGEQWTTDASITYEITSLSGYEVVIESKSGNGLNSMQYSVHIFSMETTSASVNVSETVIADRVTYMLEIVSTAKYFRLYVAGSTGQDRSLTSGSATWKPLLSPLGELFWRHNESRAVYPLIIKSTFGGVRLFGGRKIIVDFLLKGTEFPTEPKAEPANYFS
eukprot:tig00020553_g10754.t1